MRLKAGGIDNIDALLRPALTAYSHSLDAEEAAHERNRIEGLLTKLAQL
jgi:hypothetical protein